MTAHCSAEVSELLAAAPRGMRIGGAWVSSGDNRLIDVLDPASDARAAWSKTALRVRGGRLEYHESKSSAFPW